MENVYRPRVVARRETAHDRQCKRGMVAIHNSHFIQNVRHCMLQSCAGDPASKKESHTSGDDLTCSPYSGTWVRYRNTVRAPSDAEKIMSM